MDAHTTVLEGYAMEQPRMDLFSHVHSFPRHLHLTMGAPKKSVDPLTLIHGGAHCDNNDNDLCGALWSL